MKNRIITSAPTISLDDAPAPLVKELPGRYAAIDFPVDRLVWPNFEFDFGLLAIGPVGAKCQGWAPVTVSCSDDAHRKVWVCALAKQGCITVCLLRTEGYIPRHWGTDGYNLYDPSAYEGSEASVEPWTKWKLSGYPAYEAHDPQPLTGADGKHIVVPDFRVLVSRWLCAAAGDPAGAALKTHLENLRGRLT